MTDSTLAPDETPIEPHALAEAIEENYRPHAEHAVQKACHAIVAAGKRLQTEPIVKQARQMLHELDLFPDDVVDTDVWWDTVTDIATEQANAAIAKVNAVPITSRSDPTADRDRLKRLHAGLGAERTNTALDRALGRAMRERAREAGPQPQISAEAGAEILAICEREAQLGRPVLTEEWDETRGPEWEMLIADAQELGYVSIVLVREATPRPKRVPLDEWIFVIHHEALPGALWRMADTIAREAKQNRAALDPAFLRQRYLEDKVSMKQIAEECKTSATTVKKHLVRHGIELRPPGRPKTIEGTATDIHPGK
jgi:hypothetical protein